MLKHLALMVLVVALAGCGPDMSVDLPAGSDVGGRDSLNCRSLMEADMTGSYDLALTRGLEGKITKGANDASVSIENASLLRFLSGAAFSAGNASGAPFEIVANTQDQLVANYFNGDSMNTFVLNKRNGLAI